MGENTSNTGLLDKMRHNPWMLSSIVLGVLFAASIAIGGAGSSSTVESELVVSDKVLNFLNSRVNGGVSLDSISLRNGYYELMINYQGDSIPLYASLTGDVIFSDLVSTQESEGLDPNSISNQLEIVNVDTTGAPVEGLDIALITIVEFSDYQCSFCEKFYSEVLPKIRENYIDLGIVKFVYMDYPSINNPESLKASEAARCFGEQNGEYFAYHDKLYENQESLNVDNYKKWALELGANSQLFNECLDSGKYYDEIQKSLTYGSSLGIIGTPTFYVNGVQVPGTQPYEVFDELIRSMISVEKY